MTPSNDDDSARPSWEVSTPRLRLAGRPPFLVGYLAVRNRAARASKVRRLSISGLSLPGVRARTEEVVRVFARAEPGEKTEVPVRLRIDPHTPPGDYKGEMECDGERRPVVFQVLEHWRIRVSPNALSLRICPGEVVTRTVEVTNLGNMPYALHRAAFAPFQERDGWHRSLFAALKKAGTEGGQRVLDEWTREMSARELDPPVVRIRASERLLEPGESREVELEFVPPPGLVRHRSYAGSMSFENARLRFHVELAENGVTHERIP